MIPNDIIDDSDPRTMWLIGYWAGGKWGAADLEAAARKAEVTGNPSDAKDLRDIAKSAEYRRRAVHIMKLEAEGKAWRACPVCRRILVEGDGCAHG
jgi:hypothetical protein